MKKVTYTFKVTLDEDQFDKDNYSLGKTGLALTDEAQEALTFEEMVELDKAYIKDGELSIMELLSVGELDVNVETVIEEVKDSA